MQTAAVPTEAEAEAEVIVSVVVITEKYLSVPHDPPQVEPSAQHCTVRLVSFMMQ